jgi:hypothetical protein
LTAMVFAFDIFLLKQPTERSLDLYGRLVAALDSSLTQIRIDSVVAR